MSVFMRLAVAVGAIFLSLPAAHAQDEQGPWSGKVLLGYLATSGNTDNTSANLEAALNWDGTRWHHELSGRLIGQSQDNDTTAETYKATYEAKWDFTERNYLFGLLDYNKNRFTSYKQQTFQFAGIGRRFIKTENHQLEAEVAAGTSQADLQALIEPPPPQDSYWQDAGTVDEFNWRASGKYHWKIGENARFTQTLSMNSGSSNTFTESVTELGANIYGALAMVLSYKIQNNSDVQPGTEKTDTFAAISLEYAFGK
jgi:putative salt-induced outer membrane protein